ncbi:MAG: YqeG family HAD IIIA-type phosphatase [Defluviitaleaceae bacterium]|nr:YqeG family HAD IIIA-type phosphatase [Defluviitaleaceae bacterium]
MLSLLFNKYFFPKEAADSVHLIDYEKLWQMGIRGLIFDIDNTLATFDIPTPPEDIIRLLAGLAEKGFGIVMLSNNSEARVKGFCDGLTYSHIWKAGKPGAKGIARALNLLGLDKIQVALIGDQIFTDCLGGNRFGVYTILTKPIAKRDEWTVRLKRWPEKPVLRAYAKREQRHGN